MEALFVGWMKEYGYIILFIWSMLEGESGLIMAGLLSHTGDMNLFVAIFVAGLGGFAGDQVYFYIGRFNKKYVYNASHLNNIGAEIFSKTLASDLKARTHNSVYKK